MKLVWTRSNNNIQWVSFEITIFHIWNHCVDQFLVYPTNFKLHLWKKLVFSYLLHLWPQNWSNTMQDFSNISKFGFEKSALHFCKSWHIQERKWKKEERTVTGTSRNWFLDPKKKWKKMKIDFFLRPQFLRMMVLSLQLRVRRVFLLQMNHRHARGLLQWGIRSIMGLCSNHSVHWFSSQSIKLWSCYTWIYRLSSLFTGLTFSRYPENNETANNKRVAQKWSFLQNL